MFALGSTLVRSRHSRVVLQTFTGPILISVNPWKRINIYGNDTLEKYRGKFLTAMPPHVFSIAEFAYRSMIKECKNQSILVRQSQHINYHDLCVMMMILVA